MLPSTRRENHEISWSSWNCLRLLTFEFTKSSSKVRCCCLRYWLNEELQLCFQRRDFASVVGAWALHAYILCSSLRLAVVFFSLLVMGWLGLMPSRFVTRLFDAAFPGGFVLFNQTCTLQPCTILCSHCSPCFFLTTISTIVPLRNAFFWQDDEPHTRRVLDVGCKR